MRADFYYLPFKILNVFAHYGFTQCHVHLTSSDVIVFLVAREGLGKTIFLMVFI